MFPGFDPFVRPSKNEVRNFVLTVAGLLQDEFRVEVKWDVTEHGVKTPNGELMVGVPSTELRTYRIVSLPTWAAPYQIAGMIKSELILKYNAWMEGSQVAPNPQLTVKGPEGVFVVEEFSAAKKVS